MNSCSSSALLIPILLLYFRFLNHTEAATHISYPPPPYYNCSTNSTYSPNSTYHTKLETLLSWLSSNASTTAKFYNTTIAEGNTSSNTVYGFFMCRIGDGEPDCSECVINSTMLITKLCPLAKEAILWADNCFMRYSNRYFFTTVEESPKRSFMNEQDYVGQVGHFNTILYDTLNKVRNQTASTPSGSIRYGYNSENITANQTLYAMGWCIPYLSTENCSWCIGDVISELSAICCKGKIGGRVNYPSCGVRYELYPFYYTTSETLPQQPNTPAPLNPLAQSVGNEVAILESLWFDLGEIESATNKFAKENMIGKGGFGEVYKGVLSDGQEIAVKRLLVSSSQGEVEFKNEVLALTKWRDRMPLELLDPKLEGSYSQNEVIRCIHIGLLCVQEDPGDRPTMAEVVSFLNHPSVDLPKPSEQNNKMEDIIVGKLGLEYRSDTTFESISTMTVTQFDPR
ncbi:hypothetical protein Fmac_023404 [Flemingia macrophylla]|uniref:Gnk2-homologous domain-containing protein n=1 Tax=Flemingia macrophylla TaxID=520843 RepID=A0ABD1LLG7_9FABA